uniref:Uncharacterized protein n=1 Tax=Aegilops tauschii subsp. strangulata TaxID=200361 RepID=A0A453C499_AEGTS
ASREAPRSRVTPASPPIPPATLPPPTNPHHPRWKTTSTVEKRAPLHRPACPTRAFPHMTMTRGGQRAVARPSAKQASLADGTF